MRIFKRKRNLLDNKRFEIWEKGKKSWLRNLSFKKALRLEESLLSSEFIWLWRKNFFKDKPICLKDSLKKKT